MDEDKCRTCSSTRKKMRSIFDTTKSLQGMKYSEMVTTIANVKISEDDGYPAQICAPCCRKVQESYDFKLLIEKTNATLRNQSVKRIIFRNIEEVKMEVNLVKIEQDDVKPQCQELNLKFKGNENITYNNTTIKKSICSIVKEDDRKAITIHEFLDTFKTEVDDENYDDIENYGPDSNEDDNEYSKNSHKKKKKHKKVGNDEDDEDYTPGMNINSKKQKKSKPDPAKENKKVLIKPVFIKDLKLIPTCQTRKKKPKPQEKPKKKEIMCPYCGILTSSNYHILQHTGEKSFKCNECDAGFYTKALLEKHIIRHTGTKKFKCDQCVASFYEKGSLKRHILTHSDRRQSYKCDICLKSFSAKEKLKFHVKSHNLANKTVKCEHCEMKFFTKSSHNTHMRVHTGLKPQNCELCSQPYSYKRDFERHCYKKHGVYLKRRSVNVMNEEVLDRELVITQKLTLRAQEGKEGPQDNPLEKVETSRAAMALAIAMRDLKSSANVRF